MGFGGTTSLMADNGEHTHTVIVAPSEQGERLDRVLAARVKEQSRSRLKALILAGEVAIANRTIRDPGLRVNAGAEITTHVPRLAPAEPQPALTGEAAPRDMPNSRPRTRAME